MGYSPFNSTAIVKLNIANNAKLRFAKSLNRKSSGNAEDDFQRQ
jgi:hypothetical protein